MINLIIFSHSDYSYLWSIIENYVLNLKELNPIFVSNSNHNLEKPSGFVTYIEYDENHCYSQRWINILKQINSDYILVVHDVNIILNCNIEHINIILDTVIKNNIDRLSLNVFDGNDTITDDLIPLCNLNNIKKANTYTPYDVCSAIWKKESFLNLWHLFPNETYRNSENNSELQSYCRNYFKCYGLQKTNDKILYCLGRPYYNFFKILHITIQSEITFPPEVYMDSMNEFFEIFEKYKLKEKIKINYNYKSILNNFSPL